MPRTPKIKAPTFKPETYIMSEGGASVPKPPLQFSNTSQHLSDILAQYSLPRVIQCDENTVPDSAKAGTNLDLSKPLLAYSKRSVRKVHAYSVVFDPRSREFLPVGNNLLVPEDYTGWFAVFGPPENIIKDPPVPHYRSLAQLATSKCSAFLSAGNGVLYGLLTEGRHRGNNNQISYQILPGTVLKVCGLYQELEPPTKGKKKPKKGKQFIPRRFLKCNDEQDRELLVCTSQSGLFYILEQNDIPVKHPIMQMKTILERYQFPLLVKLVYGRVPTTPCSFTSTLLLTNCGKNHTVVASTLLNCRNINLEIPIATGMKFHIAEETPGLKGSRAYMNAVGICREQVSTYVKNIKVIYGEPLLEDDESKEMSEKNDSDQTEVKVPLQEEYATVQLRTPKRAASVLSRSNMDEVLNRVTITEDDSAGLSQPNTESPNQLIPKTESSESLPSSFKTSPSVIRRDKEYEPPKAETIPIRPGQAAAKPIEFQNTHEYDNHDDHPYTHEYDNSTLPRTDQSTSTDTPTEYGSAWECRSSTILIDSIPGQPVSPTAEKSANDPGYMLRPVYPENDYTPMEKNIANPTKKEAPKVPPKPKVSPKPKVAPKPQLDLPDHFPPPLTAEEIAKVDDKSDTSSLSSSGRSQTGERPQDNSYYTSMGKYQNMIVSEDGYLMPVHVDYSRLEELWSSPYDEPTDIENPNNPKYVNSKKLSVHHYMEILDDDHASPKTGPKNTDSGVFVTDCLQDEERSTEDEKRSRHNCNKSPLLPSRTKVQPKVPPPKTLGQAMVHSFSDSDVTTSSFGPSNKEKLIAELKKAGISASTELAFRGLQVADITNLLQTEGDVQEEIIALLPKVGQVDLKKIALCLREMKLM